MTVTGLNDRPARIVSPGMTDLHHSAPAAPSSRDESTGDSSAVTTSPATPPGGSRPNRRAALGLAGLAVGGITLAACGSNTPAADVSPSTSAPQPASSTEPATALAKLADVPVGSAVSATSDGKPVIVAQPTAGQAVAFSAICPHAGCTVAPKGAELDCPCHGSKFNASTGAVLNGPATKPLTPVAVTVRDGEVVPA